MRTVASKQLCCLAAIVLMASVANGRVMDMGDPRAVMDKAPLKVDRMTFEVPSTTTAGRQMLAEHAAASLQPSLKHSVTAGAIRSLASAEQPAAAGSTTPTTPVMQPAITPAQLPAFMPDTPSSAGAPAAAPVTAAPPGVTADPNSPNRIPTKPLNAPATQLPKRRAVRSRARQLVAGLQAPPLKTLDTLSSQSSATKALGALGEPAVQLQDVRVLGLHKEDVPPSTCRWAPMTEGIKWSGACAEKPLGSSCIGKVLEASPFCGGRGGSLATVKCLSSGHWGDVDVVC